MSELYEKLKKSYEKAHLKVPAERVYRDEMHKKLGLRKNQKSIRTALYLHAGKEKEMTLKMLSENISISSSETADHTTWLFIRLKGIKKFEFKEKLQHFYQISSKLKKKFHREILFLSFDMDTLVLLCASEQARQKILSYFKNSIVSDRIGDI
jgi:hypothetical protein